MARIKKSWKIRRKNADFEAIGQELNVDPVIVWMMLNRDIEVGEMRNYLRPSREDIHDPASLKDAREAVSMIMDCVSKQEKIRIIGDYDIDGMMSTYILHTGFLRVGANCDWQIPHRVTDGYGLNGRLVEEAHSDGVDLIVTCDNGISAMESIALAKSYGMKVIITDHHTVMKDEEGQDVLPPADYVVNPHRMDDESVYKMICGASVAWKLIGLLYRASGIDPEEWWDLMPFAAFATIGDVMPLRDENRAQVKLGLAQMATFENLGLRALIQLKNLDPSHITSFQVGFVLGPCLNAAGRLESASLGVELLEAKTEAEALSLAEKLSDLNERRKDMTEKGVDEAEYLLKAKGWEKDRVLVIYEPDVPESVIGIVAGRIRERTNKPTIVLTDGADCVKGSARSIPEYHMYNALHEVEHLLSKYGGHPLAAGLSLPKEKVDQFRQELNAKCTLTEEDLQSNLLIDSDMSFRYLINRPELVAELDLLEPYGTGNEKPVFAESHCQIISMRPIGKEKQYLKLTLQGKYNTKIDALFFGDCEALKQELGERYGVEEVERTLSYGKGRMELTVAYYPTINTYRGIDTTEIIISDYLVPEN